MKTRSNFTVEKIETYGSDAMVSRFAAICYDKEDGAFSRLETIAKTDHESPLRSVGMVLRLEIPLWVWKQLMRSEIGRSFLEMSFRYVKAENAEFYLPENLESAGKVILKKFYESSLQTYSFLLEQKKTKPEMARIVLPQAIYTKINIVGSLSWAYRIKKLRTDNPHAQKETRIVSEMIWKEFKENFPVICGLLENKDNKGG